VSADPETVIPQLYLHCRRCFQERKRPDIEAFVDVRGVLFVWCRAHDQKVYETKMAVMDMGEAQCELCKTGVRHEH
jgi:hypothetical protein